MTLLRYVVAVLVVISSVLPSWSQISMVLEGRGAKQKVEYLVGDPIEFRTTGDEYWNRQVITGFHFEAQRIFFENGSVAISDIEKVRHDKNVRFVRTLSRSLLLFSTQWLFFSNVARLTDYEHQTRDWIIPGVTGLGSLLVHLIGGRKVYRLKGMKRLRIKDLRWIDSPSFSGA